MDKNRVVGDADQGERAKNREALVVVFLLALTCPGWIGARPVAPGSPDVT